MRPPNNNGSFLRSFRDVARCVLGAVDDLKDEYPADVVTTVADEWKMLLAFFLNDPKSLDRPACAALSEPYRLGLED